MSLQPLKNHGDVKDNFSFVLLDSPGFKTASGIVKRQVTIDEEFDRLIEGVRSVRSRIKREEALQLLDQCIVELEKTRQLFNVGRVSDAKRKLQADERLFIDGYRERRPPKDRTPKPVFLDEDEDPDVGDPEFDVV